MCLFVFFEVVAFCLLCCGFVQFVCFLPVVCFVLLSVCVCFFLNSVVLVLRVVLALFC